MSDNQTYDITRPLSYHMKEVCIGLLCLCFSYTMMTGQSVKTFDTFDELEEYVFERGGDTAYVVNFWATWCAPCVKELPYFEELNAKHKDGKFKQILVSLDFEKQIDSRLKPFLLKHDIQSEVVVLLDGKAQNWIDRVDPSWSGAIPITVIYNEGQRLFYEQEFHSLAELEVELNKLNK